MILVLSFFFSPPEETNNIGVFLILFELFKFSLIKKIYFINKFFGEEDRFKIQFSFRKFGKEYFLET